MHDFSAAGWIFGTVILWSMLRYPVPAGEAGLILIRTLKTNLFLMRLSLSGIVLFGVVRALAYKTYEWNEAAGDGQLVLLAVKHVLLTGVFLVGVTYYKRAKKTIRERLHEETK